MTLISAKESTLRLPVLRQTLLPSLPLPSLPEKHCRQEDDEKEEEASVHFRRRARIPATEQRDPFFLTRTDLYSVCYGPDYDLLPPYHRPVDISSRENSAELEDNPIIQTAAQVTQVVPADNDIER